MRRRRGGGAGTVDFAYSDSGATHWLTHDAQTGSSPTQDQRAPFGYVVASPADRIVNIEGRSKYLNVTRLETVQINVIGKSVTWKFDTFGALLSSHQCNPGTRGHCRLRCGESNVSRGLSKVLRRSYIFVISASGTCQRRRRRMIMQNPDNFPKDRMMKTLIKQFLIVAALSTAAASVFAIGQDEPKQSIPLKDGTTLHILKDGKMAMEDKNGNPVSMKKGVVMETKDGTKIMMHGNELMRLDNYLHEKHRN